MNLNGNIPIVDTFLGSMVSQEALKSLTHKLTPINQVFSSDFMELLDRSRFNPRSIPRNLTKVVTVNFDSKYSGLQFLIGKK